MSNYVCQKIGSRFWDTAIISEKKFKKCWNILQFFFYCMYILCKIFWQIQMAVWNGTRKNGPLFSCFGFVSEFWVCCRVLGFHRLITSQHSTHTPRCSTPTPRFFVSEFPISGDQFSGDRFSRGRFFRGPFLSGTIFPRTIFPGFFWNSWLYRITFWSKKPEQTQT